MASIGPGLSRRVQQIDTPDQLPGILVREDPDRLHFRERASAVGARGIPSYEVENESFSCVPMLELGDARGARVPF